MNIIECIQGSDEWFKARLGKLTASNFDKIVTSTGKRAKSADEMVNRAVAELLVGEPCETFQSDAMVRGKELESEALEAINFVFGYNFKSCGFMDTEKGYGCSADGIDADGKKIGLELKCPLLHTHLGYLAGEILPKKYTQQVQGSLMVSEYEKWVFASYYPGFPAFKIEIEPDLKYVKTMREIIEECAEEVAEKFSKISKMVEAS